MPTKAKASAPALSPLQAKLKELRKSNKELRVGPIEELQQFTGSVFPTGNVAMDRALGIGGFPAGRIIEMYGKSMSGKTTMALQTIAEHQQRVRAGQATGAILYLDYEYSLDRKYCRNLGIDLDDDESFIYMQPGSFEDGANAFRQLAADGLLAFGVFDSVAAMTPQSEIDADTGDATFAQRAKLLHQFFRQSKGMLAKTGTSVIMLNHVMAKIDTSPMGQQMARRGIKQETTPGGTAVEFYADVRVHFKPGQLTKINETNEITGAEEKVATSTDVTALILKNKVGLPQRMAHMRVRYGKGFSQPYSVLTVLLAYARIRKDGAWYTIPADLSPTGEKTQIQGEESILRAMETDTDWFARLERTAIEQVEQHKGITDDDTAEQIDPVTGEILTPQE